MSETSYIDLIQDLLNDKADPLSKNLQGLLLRHVTLEPSASLRHLLPVVVSSPALWPKQGNHAKWQVVLTTFSTLARATMAKAELLKNEAGIGWLSHRTMRQFVDDVVSGTKKQAQDRKQHQQQQQLEANSDINMEFDKRETKQQQSTITVYDSYSEIFTLSAFYIGLKALESRRESVDPKRNGILRSIENALADSWKQAAQHGFLDLDRPEYVNNEKEPIPDDSGSLIEMLGWIAAQTLPTFPIEALKNITFEPFLNMCMTFLITAFDNGKIFDNLDNDLEDTPDGLSWKPASESKKKLTRHVSNRIYSSVPRLSRLIGRLFETIESTNGSKLSIVLYQLSRLQHTSQNIHNSWKATRWSAISDPNKLAKTTRQENLPWSIFKTLLFSMSLIHASVISLLNATTTGHDSPGQITLQLAQCTLCTFSPLQFVSAKFGNDGSGLAPYKALWYGSLDFARQGKETFMLQVLAKLQRKAHSNNQDANDIHPLDRGLDAYYLNIVEEWIADLSDEYLESKVLPLMTPYLYGPADSDAFEATHSVILAIFLNNKQVAAQLLPWYTEFLIKNSNDLLDSKQFRVGYAGTVRYASSVEDSLAWFCIERLLEAIHVADETVPEPKDSKQSGQQQQQQQTQQEQKQLSPKMMLSMALIDQCRTVNSSLLDGLLNEIKLYINGLPQINDKMTLSRALYSGLSSGMDTSKRLDAASWWLNNGPDLVQL